MPLTPLRPFLKAVVLVLSTTLSQYGLAAEQAPNDRAALASLKETRAVFDITTSDPRKLKFYLGLIAESAASIEAQGVKPEFVLAFRGPATRYMSTDHRQLDPEQAEAAAQISALLDKLGKTPHVHMEQCAVAAKVLKVETSTIHPSVTVVGNSWISLMGYQNRGYALIPVR